MPWWKWFYRSDGNTIVDCLDAEPDCATNDTDECGICAGDNSTCSGCTDSEAFNFDCLTGEIPQSAINGCGHNVTVDDGSCIYTQKVLVNQSSLQAFYFVGDADLDEESLVELDDWIGVFRGDVCVGAAMARTIDNSCNGRRWRISEDYLLSVRFHHLKFMIPLQIQYMMQTHLLILLGQILDYPWLY